MKNLKNFMFCLALLFASCAEERPEQIDQSSAINLLEIGDYQGKEYELNAIEKLHDGAIFTNATDVTVEKSTKNINNLGLVRYETNSPLFEDVPFFGKPGQKYTLRYEVTSDYLIINKIAQKKDIPFQELTFAEKISDDTYKIPLIGYPVTLFKLQRRLDINNEPTHEFFKARVYGLNEATHFDIDFRSRKTFQAANKNNVFPSDMFEGEWFYAATVVSASPEKANSIGRDLSIDFKARSVSRIKFIKRPNGIVGLNLNTDENIDVTDDINLKEAINIPAEYVDFKREKVGNNPTLEEERIDDSHEERRPFDERSYVKLDFGQTISALTRPDNSGSLNTSGALLDSLELGEGYAAFVIYYPLDEVRIRYALRKAHKPKKGRVYFKDDRKRFGYFGTKRFAILNHRYEREDARERLTYINRFYPEDGKIVYYFSNTTPDHMKEAGRQAIKVWDEAFKKAETGFRVVLDESKTVALGDIRYNIINIVDTKDGARLLGYGPSIVDSDSGEIISATSNIYANPFRESWINILRNYIRSQTGMFKGVDIGVPSPEKMTLYTSFSDKFFEDKDLDIPFKEENSSELLRELGLDVKDNTQYFKDILKKKEIVELRKNNSLNKNQQEEGLFHFNGFDVHYKDSLEKISENCGDTIDNYIKELKSLNVSHTENELEILNTCADKLLMSSVVGTLIHELGHNFGLRHNFIASTDKENYIKDDQGNILVKSSSTMDYIPSTHNEPLHPGPYDVAAIAFGYANKVITLEGGLKGININASLKDQEDKSNLAVKDFKFCTDQDVQRIDPLCERHDFGTTPMEVVQNTINRFYSSYTLYGRRYDRANGPSSLGFGIGQLIRTFLPLKQIYDQWRFHLREFIGEREQYLASLNSEDYNEILESMKNHQGRFGKLYKEYFEASKVAYNFLKEIIFTPSKTCVLERIEGQTKVLADFEAIKETIFAETKVTINTCDHPLVFDFYEPRGLKPIDSFGEFFVEQNETLDISDIDYKLTNAIGFAPLKRAALIALTGRSPMMEHLAIKRFAPNFLDNPLYRKEIVELTYHRIINGMNTERFGHKFTSPMRIKLFKQEKDFLISLGRSVVQGMMIPGNLEESDKRKRLYSPNVTTNPNIIPEQGYVKTQFRNYYIFARDTGEGFPTFNVHLINKRNELKDTLLLFEGDIVLPDDSRIQDAKGVISGLAFEPFFVKAEEIENGKFTVGDFQRFHQQVLHFSADIEQFEPGWAFLLNKLFDALSKNIQMASVMYNQKKGDFSLQLPLKELDQYFEMIFGEGVRAKDLFDRDKLTSNMNGLRKTYEQKLQLREMITPYRSDLEAQLDITTELLLTL